MNVERPASAGIPVSSDEAEADQASPPRNLVETYCRAILLANGAAE